MKETSPIALDMFNGMSDLFLTTEEVAEIAGVKQATLSQWINRGHVVMRFNRRAGSGKKMLYSFGDLLEIVGVAHLSRIGFPPGRISGKLSESVMGSAVRRLADMVGGWGDPDKSQFGADFERYLIVWFNPTHKNIDWETSSTTHNLEFVNDAAWTVVDSHKILAVSLDGVDAIRRRQSLQNPVCGEQETSRPKKRKS